MDLKEKIIIVTGSSSGIGEAIAEKFGGEGAKVILCARRANLLMKNTERIKSKGGDAYYFQIDITNDNEVKNMIDSIMKSFGKIDILVNNAGVALGGNIDDFPMENFDNMMNLNLRGLYFITKLVVPIMKEQKSGAIINISSGSGVKENPSQSAYGASKAGVIKMGESIAEELKPFSVKVHTVCPGMVAVKNQYANLQKEKILQPSDIADTVVYLAKLPQRVNIPEVTIVPYYPINMIRK
ncbi:SDR family oxidoreductase [Candidatus Woesearchaeota archaeon]|nr:SDR family oxidoreductase [Candidatus Woesearchaeota archaeon]